MYKHSSQKISEVWLDNLNLLYFVKSFSSLRLFGKTGSGRSEIVQKIKTRHSLILKFSKKQNPSLLSKFLKNWSPRFFDLQISQKSELEDIKKIEITPQHWSLVFTSVSLVYINGMCSVVLVYDWDHH
jgi:hypothetical protein